MEQTKKPTFGQIAAVGIVAAFAFAVARFLRMEGGPANESIAQFLATIGWLAGVGAILLMFLWAAKSVRS